ncbi:Digalactosyldiacylglycerol synthase 1, chloroplastic [Capsicum baccatum]|uniref:Digalactosyldiacylglycerol synthase 1, chloroplastic n=1 Tax=Capsicum baccatum TaxID=33114 RepID=A0A2G2VSF1_CAPBA|nr:Digalactosyldiacylglycerol synthase 1, chloroplastic [Capsicum baccatum]
MKAFGDLKLVTFLVLGICAFLILGVECEDDDASVIHKDRVGIADNERLAGVVLFARERLLQRLRGVSISGNRVQIQGLDWSSDKKVEWDPDVERELLPSGKPLVPEYSMRFIGGSSSKFPNIWALRLVCELLQWNTRKMAAERQSGQQVFLKGVYFLGKMVRAKGYRELIDLLAKNKSDLDGFNMDVFGNGEYAYEVQTITWALNLNVNFIKGRDHANDSLHRYEPFS